MRRQLDFTWVTRGIAGPLSAGTGSSSQRNRLKSKSLIVSREDLSEGEIDGNQVRQFEELRSSGFEPVFDWRIYFEPSDNLQINPPIKYGLGIAQILNSSNP